MKLGFLFDSGAQDLTFLVDSAKIVSVLEVDRRVRLLCLWLVGFSNGRRRA